MHQLIDKKFRIILYFFLLIILTTINNYSKNINFNKSILGISKINVSGLLNNQNLEIEKKLEVILNQNIFFLKSIYIKEILNDNNLIEDFIIRKKYPNEIYIEIKKAQILAITKKNKEIFFIASNGKTIPYEENLDKNNNLPHVIDKTKYGKNLNDNFISFFNLVKNSKFQHDKIIFYYFFPSNRWDIKTKDDILVKLPLDNTLEALNLLVELSDNNEFNKKIIDLRISNKIITSND